MCARARVRACVRACKCVWGCMWRVRACVRACVRADVHVCGGLHVTRACVCAYVEVCVGLYACVTRLRQCASRPGFGNLSLSSSSLSDGNCMMFPSAQGTSQIFIVYGRRHDKGVLMQVHAHTHTHSLSLFISFFLSLSRAHTP